MQQKVSIIVVCNSSGKALYNSAKNRLASDGFKFDPAPLLKKSHLAFNLNYIDVWSTGDSFSRFLYPKSKIIHFSKGSSELWTIRREHLQIRNSARNEEEQILRSFLLHAKSIYRKASAESYLFLVRSVFDASVGFTPEAEQGAAANP